MGYNISLNEKSMTNLEQQNYDVLKYWKINDNVIFDDHYSKDYLGTIIGYAYNSIDEIVLKIRCFSSIETDRATDNIRYYHPLNSVVSIRKIQ